MIDVEKRLRRNNRLLSEEYVEPVRFGPATLVSAFNYLPATVILIEPRRCLIQIDRVIDGFHFERDLQGVIHGFRRHMNRKNWKYAATDDQGRVGVHLLAGRKLYEEFDVG